MEFAFLDVGQRQERSLAKHRDAARHHRRVAPAQQHGLAAGEPCGVAAGDGQRRQRRKPGLDRQQRTEEALL